VGTRARAIRDRPLFTETHLSDFVPERGSLYVFAISSEERAGHVRNWQKDASDVDFVEITEQNPTDFTVKLHDSVERVSLRSSQDLSELWKRVSSRMAFLDITGLSHHVWAPLLRSALSSIQTVRVLYVEPLDYRLMANPREGEIFDLSERIMGIAPIPGFACLTEADEENTCFIPLLGFEGTRFAYVLEQVQPPGRNIVPIIGVPGFRPEFPFHRYLGNKLPLLRTRSWLNVRFAPANCPFSLFYELEAIASNYPKALLQIAPIGTKPHALGAVLYAMATARPVELVYDHPIRRPQRTSGVARSLVYHVSAFLASSVRS